MTPDEHIRRLATLRTLRAPLEAYWRQAYAMTYPLRGQQFGTQAGYGAVLPSAEAASARIYDSTLRYAVRSFASSLLTGLTPSTSRWAGLYIHNWPDSDHAVKQWLNESADVIWRNIHASNYDVVAYEAFQDLIITGMFALYITRAPEGSGQLYDFRQWPLSSLYCADSTGRGHVDTVYRVLTLTAEQAVAEYGTEVSEQVQRAAEKKPDTPFEFLQAILPRKNPGTLDLPVESVHIEIRTKKVLRESGYEEMPVIVPRWLVIPESVYSVGAVDDTLPDARTLNEVVKLILSNADLAISGMWGAVDDGVLNPKTVKVGPRKIVPVANRDSFFPLVSGTKFDVAQMEVTRLQTSIRRGLMADQLQPQDGPAMTATEVHIRTQLVRQLLAPMFGRFQSELLKSVVTRCFGIAYRAGAFNPAPPQIRDRNAIVTFSSPLARSQKLEDVGAMDRFEASLAMLMKEGMPDALDNYDVDAAVRAKADLLGVPAKLLRDDNAVMQLRRNRAAAMQEQQKQAQAQDLRKMVIAQSPLLGGAASAG